MIKCTLRVIYTVFIEPGDTSTHTAHTTSLPTTVSSLRPQYSRARLVKEITGYGSENGEFRAPWAVVCTPTGMVIVSGMDNNCIQMFTEDLEHIRSVGSKGAAAGQFWCPAGITTDGRGHIFIADNGNNRIQVIDEQGHHLYVLGSKGSGPGQYEIPYGITIDTNQRLYVCDRWNNRVQVVAADGHHLSMLTHTGPGSAQLRSPPWCISSNSHNDVTIADWAGNLYMFNDKGAHIRTLLCGQPGGFSAAAGTVTDAWGTLLVADHKEGCVCVMDEEGRISCRIWCKGTESGQIGRPFGMALTNRGDLIVCDCDNDRILKYVIPKS